MVSLKTVMPFERSADKGMNFWGKIHSKKGTIRK